MEFDPIYKKFHKALVYLSKTKWNRRLNAIALDSNISSGYISDLINGNKKASYKKQKAIAAAMGETWESFIAIGAEVTSAAHITGTPGMDHFRAGKLIYSDHADQPAPLPPPGKVLLLPAREKLPPTPEALQAQAAHRNLDTILESGHNVLIAAILSNLVAFAEDVEARKERDQLKKQVAELEAWKRQVESAG